MTSNKHYTNTVMDLLGIDKSKGKDTVQRLQAIGTAMNKNKSVKKTIAKPEGKLTFFRKNRSQVAKGLKLDESDKKVSSLLTAHACTYLTPPSRFSGEQRTVAYVRRI